MKKESIIAIIILISALALTAVLAICGVERKFSSPPKVQVYVSPISGISPAFFTISVTAESVVPIEKVRINLEKSQIYQKEIVEDGSFTDEVDRTTFNGSISSERRYFEISFEYELTYIGEVAKIFEFSVDVEDSAGNLQSAKADVIVYSNKPCEVRIYFVAPSGRVPISLPPFPVQLGALVTDDRCGSFSHTLGVPYVQGRKCEFKFEWDADYQGKDFSPDGETDEPTFTFTYNKIGIYTPKVRVFDDGGNVCESSNLEPVYVMRQFQTVELVSIEQPTLLTAEFFDSSTKLVLAKQGFLFEYGIENNNFFIQGATSLGISGIGVKFARSGAGDFLLYKVPTELYIFPATPSGVINWSLPYKVVRQFDEAELVSFDSKVTFIAFFFEKILAVCPFYPPDRDGNVCFIRSLDFPFSRPFSVFAYKDTFYVAYFSPENYEIVGYLFNLTYYSQFALWLPQEIPQKFKFLINYAPAKLDFFSEGGKVYLLISTGDNLDQSKRGIGFRSYILDIESCVVRGSCSTVDRVLGISMPEVIGDIPDTEICALLDQNRYRLNIYDFIVSQNFSLCPGNLCIVSTLCMDLADRGCIRTALYPFIFSSSTVVKNMNTNCILLPQGVKNLLFVNGETVILSNPRFIFNASASSNLMKLLDIESFQVYEPFRFSGFQDGINLILAVGGKGGVDVLEFNNKGELSHIKDHIYPKVINLQGDIVYDLGYDLIYHFYDGEILVGVLQKAGCGEPDNFSGLVVYSMLEKVRKVKRYKHYSDFGAHSINVFSVKKFGNKYVIALSGTKCQVPGAELFLFLLDTSDFSLTEITRLKFDESINSILIHSYEGGNLKVFVSTPSTLHIVGNSGVMMSKKGEGGGLLYFYKGVLYEFIQVGNFLDVRTFDDNLNKIKEFSFYLGMYPEVSGVLITNVIDEFFGNPAGLEIAFLIFTSSQPDIPFSLLLALDITDFVRNKGEISLFGAVPNYGIGAKDITYMRGLKNIIFLLDVLRGDVIRLFMK